MVASVFAQQPSCRVSVDNISTASLALQIREQRLALAIFQLGMAIRTYKPFVQELSLVQKLGIEEGRLRDPIDKLLPHAATGVATINELRDSFGVILLPKLEALNQANEISWVSQVWYWFVTTVAPSVTGDTQSATAAFRQTLTSSAMDRLSEDDLRGAVELLTQLDGPGAQIAARWIIEASKRLDLDAAYESLSEIITVLLNCTP